MKYQDCEDCKKCDMFCPLIIIGPGVREHTKEFKDAEKKRNEEFAKEIKPLLEKMIKNHPELKNKKMAEEFAKEDVAKIMDTLNNQFKKVFEEKQLPKYEAEPLILKKTNIFVVDDEV